jgi:hypothetical protein
MKREDDQRLWDLLGQARPADVSSFFARNVVRTIRQRPEGVERLRRWFSPRKLIPATALAATLVAAMLIMHRPASLNPADHVPDVVATIDPQDYDVVADLDELTAGDETNLWDDDTQTL